MTRKLMTICAFALTFSGVNLLTPPNTSEAFRGLVGIGIVGLGSKAARANRNNAHCIGREFSPACRPVACREEYNQDSDKCKWRELLDAPRNLNSSRINGEQNAEENDFLGIYPQRKTEEIKCNPLRFPHSECGNDKVSAPE